MNALTRRNAEEALRESEERLGLAAASAEVGFWVLDPGSGHIWAFVRQNEKKLNKPVERIDRRSMEALSRCAWPGNARELRIIVEHAMITSGGGTLHLCPPDPRSDKLRPAGTIEEVERRYVLDVLNQTGWRITRPNGAAEILGLKRTTLQSKMKRLGIQRGTA